MKIKFIKYQLILTALFIAKASSSIATDYNAEFDDWIVSSSCTNRTSKLCHGNYLEPKYPYPLNNQDEHPTQITADDGELIPKGTSTFNGNVVVQQGNQQLKTDKATITHNGESGDLEILDAEGNVKITEPNLRVDGSRATIYQKENRKVIDNSTYRIYSKHARGTADFITIEKQTKMQLPNASYTTCAPNSNTWYLRAKMAKFNKETGRGEAWHSWLYIKNVKVFYWPYINFPIDNRRQTGFLMPSVHNSSSNGASISAPFYWNLAPNYDAILTPHYMTKRGAKLDTQFRYLTHNSEGSIKFNFLPRDKEYQNFRTKKLMESTNITKQDPRYVGLKAIHRRYSFSITDKTTFNKQFKSEIDYTKIGDDNYIIDFNGDIIKQNLPLQSQLASPYFAQPGLASPYLAQPGNITPAYSSVQSVRQKAELRYLASVGTLTSKLEQFQVLHPFDGPIAYETLKTMPALDFQSSTFDLPQNFNWRFSGNYTKFALRKIATDDTSYTGIPLSPGERYHWQPTLTHSFESPGWFIRPSIQLDVTSYQNMKLSKADLSNNKLMRATRSIPIYNINAGLIFDRDLPLNIANNQFLQTLEPQAYYLYVPKRRQNLLPIFDSAPLAMDYNQIFRNNRYSGFDRIGEANQLGLGIKSRFLTKQTNEEKASVGIGRILYFQDRVKYLPGDPVNNQARLSPIAAFAKYQIRPEWNIEGNIVKENLKQTNSSSVVLQYITDPTHIINLGYQFIRIDIPNQDTKKLSHLRTLQVSSSWELIPQVQLLGRVGHDLHLSRVTNVLFGIEKHDCCTILRAVWMRNIKPSSNLLLKQYESAISLQFVLKGLTQAGSIDNNELSSMIPGYIAKDNEF